SRRTVSDLLAEGYDSELVRSLPSGSAASSEIEAQERDRRRFDDDSSTVNEAMREVDVTEHYIRADLDGSGLARLWKAATAGSGDTLLTRKGKPDLEPVDEMPFASITPVMVSHRFEGLSIAELVMDIQRIKTALLRQWLDNLYFQNNQRVEVSEQHASDHTLDDLLTNRPGGLIRTKMPGGIIPIPNNPIGQHIAPLLQYMDSETEQRSGATRQGMGLDPNALQKTTATGANLFANAAQMRVRMIARIFAETGLKRLFMLLHGALRKHQDKEKVVRLRGRWVPVDPRGWRTRSDMTAHVGLGTGSRDQQQQYLLQILGFQTKAVEMQGGIAGPLVGLPNLYNTLKRLVENAGLRSVQPYFMAPGEEGAAPQPKTDSKADEVQAQLQLDRMKAEGQLAIDRMRAEAEAQLARERMLAEIALKHEQVRIAALAPPLAPQAVQLGGRMG
ncbi:MAG: hypothetical protein K2Q10_14120, partial [Rhodospirillales bacterium]|nr:hypothetical protein [Rhodospirillales bacterium]